MAKRGRLRGIDKQLSPKRHPNKSEKRALKAAEIALLLKQAGRKAQRKTEPNDRDYEPAALRGLRQVSATQLDQLIRDDEDD